MALKPAPSAAKKAAPVATKKVAPAESAPAKKLPFGRKPGFPARKPGSKPAVKKSPWPAYAAPADFKSHFLLIAFKTEVDGLIGRQIKATRYQGNFNRDADEKKMFNLASYDSPTLVGIAARLGAVTFKATNDKKLALSPKERANHKGSARLPASTVFEVLVRVGVKKADNSLTSGVRQIFQIAKTVTGRVKPLPLLKTDPAYRLIRRATRFLPAAFTNVQMPPKRTRGTRKTDDEDAA